MGIRLNCPNGHPLHVKTELAGKRGICPECQARFVIPVPQRPTPQSPTPQGPSSEGPSRHSPGPQAPTPPNGSAAAKPAPAAVAAPTSQQAPPAQAVPVAPLPSAATPLPASPAAAVPGTAHPPAAAGPVPVAPATPQGAWYVRPSGGGQYGPADELLLRQWIAERRVDAAALVWCTGWPDWRPLSDVPGLLPDASPTPAGIAPPTGFEISGGDLAPPTGSPAAVATARYIRRKKRSANGQLIAAGALLVLALLLGGVLLWVLNRQPAAPPGTPAATPVDPPPQADDAPAGDMPAEGEGENADEPSTE